VWHSWFYYIFAGSITQQVLPQLTLDDTPFTTPDVAIFRLIFSKAWILYKLYGLIDCHQLNLWHFRLKFLENWTSGFTDYQAFHFTFD
jgi:hypothetical protein